MQQHWRHPLQVRSASDWQCINTKQLQVSQRQWQMLGGRDSERPDFLLILWYTSMVAIIRLSIILLCKRYPYLANFPFKITSSVDQLDSILCTAIFGCSANLGCTLSPRPRVTLRCLIQPQNCLCRGGYLLHKHLLASHFKTMRISPWTHHCKLPFLMASRSIRNLGRQVLRQKWQQSGIFHFDASLFPREGWEE